VAKLAGLPRGVIARARQVLVSLEKNDDGPQLDLLAHAAPTNKPSAAAAEAVLGALAEVDPDQTTPLAALSVLAELKRLART
jgi:DNA mismatch repair protein MutS